MKTVRHPYENPERSLMKCGNHCYLRVCVQVANFTGAKLAPFSIRDDWVSAKFMNCRLHREQTIAMKGMSAKVIERLAGGKDQQRVERNLDSEASRSKRNAKSELANRHRIAKAEKIESLQIVKGIRNIVVVSEERHIASEENRAEDAK